MRINCGVGLLSKPRSRCIAVGVILNTAFVDRIVGRGRSAFGIGGGRAATCGEAGSDDNDFAVGTTTGGESFRGCFALELECASGGL